MTKKLNKKFVLGTLLMLLTAATLAACGDSANTATSAPIVATTGPASPTTAGISSNGTTANGAAPNPPNGTPGAPGAGRGTGQGGFNVATGTVQTYDAASKSLTIMETSGSAQTFDASNAVISKNAKITLADLGKETLSSDIIQVTGTKGSDGTYTATALTLADQASFGNGGFPGAGANGTPGANGGTPGAFNGTPGQGRRGAGANGTVDANGTPGANAGTGNGGFGGPNGGNRLMLRNATLSGNTLTGTDQTGASVTVNLSDTTTITKRTTDTATDLAAGANVSVNFRAAQNNGTASAVAVTIEQ